MAELKSHKYVNSLPSILEANSIYFVRVGSGFDIYTTNSTGTIVAYAFNKHGDGIVNQHIDVNVDLVNAQDGDEVIIVGGVLVKKPRPIIIESPNGEWKTSTNDIDNPITDPAAINTNVGMSLNVNFSEAGLWKPYISFLYSVDSTGSDFQAEARLNNISIAKCQPSSGRIVRQEGKDAALQNPDNSSAGTAQVLSYGMDFHAFNIVSSGSFSFVLLFGPEQNGVEANIGEITVEFRRVYGVQKS